MASTKVNEYGITDMQQAFADEYIVNPQNATQAAIKAGYAPTTARSKASQLLTKVNVQKYIKERQKDLEDAKIADQKEVLQFWSAGLRGERHEQVVVSTPDGAEVVDNELSEKDKLKNSELLAKATGMFIDRHEITNTQPIIIASVDTSDDEKIEVDDDESNTDS